MRVPNLHLFKILMLALDALEAQVGEPMDGINYARAEVADIAAAVAPASLDKMLRDLQVAATRHKEVIQMTRIPWLESMDEATQDALFIYAFSTIAARAHANAVKKEFWEGPKDAMKLAVSVALIHSEISEALEGIRKHNPADEHCEGFGSVEVEFADAVIRIMDNAQAYGLPVAEALVAKMRFNATRPPKHGKAF